ncbi:MAG: phosphate acetyltransferase, partial [Gammaproteobacteria bacterium]
MAKALFMAPTGEGAGLTSVCLGLVRALDAMGVRVGYLKPVAQPLDSSQACDRSVYFARNVLKIDHPEPIPLETAQRLAGQGDLDDLMEQVVELFQQVSENCDVVVVEGLAPVRGGTFMARININVARTLNAEVILVTAPGNMDADELDAHLDLAARLYAAPEDPDVIGCILNKVNAPEDTDTPLQFLTHSHYKTPKRDYASECQIFRRPGFQLIGSIPWRPDMIAPRTRDVAQWLNTLTLHAGEVDRRRVMRISVVARTVPNMVEQLTPGTLVVTPGDREDVLIATSMAALIGRPLAGLILT